MSDKTEKFISPEGVLEQYLENESVFLNLNTQMYHGLNETGAKIWRLLVEHGEKAPVLEIMSAEYGIDKEIVRRDLDDLIEKLLERGLLAVSK